MRYSDIRRTVTIDPDDFDYSHFEQNCSQAIEQYYEGNAIFRGTKRSANDYSILFGDSRQYTRKSANTTNYYTLLIDHILPNWKSYPPRSKSWICTSLHNTATFYGIGYIVFPFNDTQIAIAPAPDFWNSFRYLSRQLAVNPNINNMDDFNRELREIGNEVLGAFDESVDSINQLILYFEKNGQSNLDKRILRTPLMKAIVNKYNGDMRKALTDLLSPTKNGFKLTTIQDYEFSGNHELWFSGPAYFFEPEIFEEMY